VKLTGTSPLVDLWCVGSGTRCTTGRIMSCHSEHQVTRCGCVSGILEVFGNRALSTVVEENPHQSSKSTKGRLYNRPPNNHAKSSHGKCDLLNSI
jgi:hypothetical protein